jgi:hypothetical protein
MCRNKTYIAIFQAPVAFSDGETSPLFRVVETWDFLMGLPSRETVLSPTHLFFTGQGSFGGHLLEDNRWFALRYG